MVEITYKNKKRLYKFANMFCNLFNPFVIPIHLVLILMYAAGIFSIDNFRFEIVAMLFLAILMLSTPLVLLVILKRLKVVSSYSLDSRKDSVNFAVPTVVYYVMMLWFIIRDIDAVIISRIFTSVVELAIVTTVIKCFWRINVYTVALGGFATMLYLLDYIGLNNADVFFVISLLCLGIVGSSTMFLRKNNLFQTIVGVIVGSVTVMTIMAL
ncbi:MAG: hypothetical protein R3Y51_04915 [Rikenellaceae bacterium]